MINIVEKAKVDRFKYWIIGIINGIQAKDLFQMIKDNDVPLLFDLELPPYFNWVKDSVIEKKDDILEALTYENVIKYSGEFRPDLKELILHERGREWIKRFFKVLVFMIENVELSSHEMKRKFLKKAKAIQEGRLHEMAAVQLLHEQKEQMAHKQAKIEKELERENVKRIRSEKREARRTLKADRQLRRRRPPKEEKEKKDNIEEDVTETQKAPFISPRDPDDDSPLAGMY